MMSGTHHVSLARSGSNFGAASGVVPEEAFQMINALRGPQTLTITVSSDPELELAVRSTYRQIGAHNSTQP